MMVYKKLRPRGIHRIYGLDCWLEGMRCVLEVFCSVGASASS